MMPPATEHGVPIRGERTGMLRARLATAPGPMCRAIRGGARSTMIVALAGFAACASNPAPDDPCGFAVPSVSGWTTYDEGAFTLQLPPEYASVEVQGIDSQVGRWEAPGRTVSYDFGRYSNPLQPNGLSAFPDLVVCQESDGRGTPRIIRYSPPEGGFAVSAHWPDVRQSAGVTESLTLDGVVQQPEDQGEILAIIRSVQISEGQAAGAADRDSVSAGGAAAGATGSTVAAGPDHAGYRASGNEPFWLLTFGEATMDFFDVGASDTITVARPEPQRLADGWRFTATADDQPYLVEVRDRRCGDSMSGRPFPHTVTVTVHGKTFTGCGGETSTLLTGPEWRVSQLEGTETTGSQRPTLSFEAGGALTGTGGCNRFRATYEITGEGITIGPAVATRMACIDPEANAQETRFFALLERITRFDIAETGALVLLAGDQPIITAER